MGNKCDECCIETLAEAVFCPRCGRKLKLPDSTTDRLLRQERQQKTQARLQDRLAAGAHQAEQDGSPTAFDVALAIAVPVMAILFALMVTSA